MKIANLPPTLPLKGITPPAGTSNPTPAAEAVGQTFAQALDSLNQTQLSSDALMEKLAAGEEVELHQVMIAAEQADIGFRVALAIRDKLVDAYRETMRMNV